MPNNPPSSQENSTTTTPSQGTVPTDPNLQKKVIKVAALRRWKKSKVTLAKVWIDNESVQKARGLERPVIIISRNSQNATAGNVIIIPLSKQLRCQKDQKGRVYSQPSWKPNTEV